MNKTVFLLSSKIRHDQHEFQLDDNFNVWGKFDAHIAEKYGLSNIEQTDRYKIVDESKFSIFMLMYAEYIRGVL
jgi:hypothetical protein